jgi:hypothetical protein
MPTVYVETEVDVSLSDFDTDDLVEEIEKRGRNYNYQLVDGDEMRSVLEQVWQRRRQGQDYQQELDRLIWGVLGRMI